MVDYDAAYGKKWIRNQETNYMLGVTREIDFRAGSEMISIRRKYPGKEIQR